MAGGLGKLQTLRYDNRGDPAALTARDTGWETKFWRFGAAAGFEQGQLDARYSFD